MYLWLWHRSCCIRAILPYVTNGWTFLYSILGWEFLFIKLLKKRIAARVCSKHLLHLLFFKRTPIFPPSLDVLIFSTISASDVLNAVLNHLTIQIYDIEVYNIEVQHI